MPLVKLLGAVYLALSSVYFSNDAASVEGRWVCATKSGYADEQTWYQINCGGEINFFTNGTLESSCSEAFAPTGSHWRTEGSNLLLADSDGQTFATYTWKTPDERTLLLERKGLTYTFERVVVPRTSSH
jgi:hypothetical protein